MSNRACQDTSCCGTRAESNSRCEGRPQWQWPLQLYRTLASAVTQLRTAQTNSVRCCAGDSDSWQRHVVHRLHCRWKNNRGAGVRKPHIRRSRARLDFPSPLWWKGNEHLGCSPLLFIYLQNYTLLLLDCVPMCFVMFLFKQNIYACGLWPWHTQTHTHTTHSPIQLSPLCQRSPLPFPLPLTKHCRTAKGNFKVAGGGTPFFLALVII